ncbi:hypothetical protein [Thermophilibacter sp.]|uniref:hypothetical protein n=1 Tax=Thermophilibacter sp. TaxID=2847309 RepID=UPI003A92804E
MGVGTSLVLRPSVPMGHVTGAPYVVALAVARELGGRVRWPHEVVTASGESLVSVDARAGYDEGVFVRCDLVWEDEKGLDAAALERVAGEAVDAWADDVATGRAAAGPLAPVLSDYFDALLGMGEKVEVLRGGRVIGEGALVAVDVWGRATVRLKGGAQELEVAPEQARLRYV